VQLESPITGGPWTGDSTVFVETQSRRLFAFDADSLAAKWNVDAGEAVADAPLHADNRWHIATQAGSVLVLSEDGQQQQRIEVLTPLSHLLLIGRNVVAVGLDGALHPLPKDAAADQADGAKSPAEATQ
jgi:outer membrane protein assembly factor BamB